MSEKTMLMFVNETIRSLCKETGEALVSRTLSNDGEDFKTKRYGGVEISPIVILNSGIAKIVESLINGDPVDEENKEKELLMLLMLKRSGIILAKGLKEAEEERARVTKEEAKIAKKLASMSEDAKKIVSDPEFKKRRKKRLGVDVSTAIAEQSDIMDIPKMTEPVLERVIDSDGTVRDVPVKGCISDENPFDELDAIEKKAPNVSSMDDFLAQEKLKALNALNDEPTI